MSTGLGLDTNVLVRFLVRGDGEQFERAQRLIRRHAQARTPPLVSHLMLLGTEPPMEMNAAHADARAIDLASAELHKIAPDTSSFRSTVRCDICVLRH